MSLWALLHTSEGLPCSVSTVMLPKRLSHAHTQTCTHIELQTRNLPCLDDIFFWKKKIVSVRHSTANIFIHSFMKVDKLDQNIQGHKYLCLVESTTLLKCIILF